MVPVGANLKKLELRFNMSRAFRKVDTAVLLAAMAFLGSELRSQTISDDPNRNTLENRIPLQPEWTKFRGKLLNTGYSTSTADDPNWDGTISDSEIVWSYQMRGKIVSSPAIANGAVYLGSGDGIMHCFTAPN